MDIVSERLQIRLPYLRFEKKMTGGSPMTL
jgi:hypothetical protein